MRLMTKPRKFQKKGVKKIHRFNGRALLADEMGLGKTLQSLLYAYQKQEWPCIVVCEAGLKVNWQHEAKVHFGINAQIINGRTRPKNFKITSKIVIINYEILKDWVGWLRKQGFKVCIIDECQKLGNLRNLWTKATFRLCASKKKFKISKPNMRIICLSGTPLTNYPAELWPTLHLLRPDLWAKFYTYARRYCAPELKPWGWEYRGADNLKQLHRRLKKQVMIRRTVKQVLKELPKQSRNVQMLQITKKKEYDEAERDFLNWLTKKSPHLARRARKAQRLVKMGYLKRLAAEFKLPAVVEWIQNFLKQSRKKKLIVFCYHRSFMRKLAETFPDALQIHGAIRGEKRHKVIEKFRRNKKKRLLFGQIKATCTGWNGTMSQDAAIVEFPWAPGIVQQACARIHRIGQKKRTRVWFLVASETIEEKICKLLMAKQKNIEAVLDGKAAMNNLKIFDELERELVKTVRKAA